MTKTIFHELSFWEREAFLTKNEICIVGSGIVGLNAALALRQKYPNAKILVLERGLLPYGASTRNAGFACFGSISELLDDLSTQSEAALFSLIEKRWRGLQALKSRLGEAAIGFEGLGGYEIFSEKEEAIFEACASKIPYFNQMLKEVIGKEVYSIDNQVDRFGFAHIQNMIRNQYEGQIDTGKMMHSLMTLARQQGIEILTGFALEHWQESDKEVILYGANAWKIKTSALLFASNGFTQSL